MCNAFLYQLLINAQPSSPGQLPPPILYPEHNATGYGTYFCPAWDSCPSCVSFHLLVPPQPPRRRGKRRS